MISNSIILSPVASAIVFYNYNISVSSLKVQKFIKQGIKMSQFISNIHECVNSSITRTQFSGTVCKPCECRVNRVKVVFNRTRLYQTVLGTVRQSHKNRVQTVTYLA